MKIITQCANYRDSPIQAAVRVKTIYFPSCIVAIFKRYYKAMKKLLDKVYK